MKIDVSDAKFKEALSKQLNLRDIPLSECVWVDNHWFCLKYSERYDILKRFERLKNMTKKEV